MSPHASPSPRPAANVCSHTGLTKPECHCPACLRALVERHRPTGTPAKR